MPLHLLGKKSWNVYNPAAIAKVRADEAAQRAREEAEEQRQDDYDAARRLAILRGLPPPPAPPSPPRETQKRVRDSSASQRNSDARKRRRLHGEDDTDRDIRIARQDRDQRHESRNLPQRTKPEHDTAITDHAGHIQLFAPPSTKEIRASRDAEAENKRQVKDPAEQDALRFSDASGFRKNIKEMPWYATSRTYSGTEEVDNRVIHNDNPGKDAFGNDDPHREKRDAARTASADPMAMMRQAQTRLKEVERERETWKRERDQELEPLSAVQHKEEERDRRKRRRHVRKPMLDDFSLDASNYAKTARPIEEHRDHRHQRGRSRERSLQSRQEETGNSGTQNNTWHMRKWHEEARKHHYSRHEDDR